MTDQAEATQSAPPRGHLPGIEDNLGPKSYTLQRLQHASPEHLHLTTRRYFIGPIPEAWLSKHRKSWFKHRPRRLSTYSSKSATFAVGDGSTDLVDMVGVDGSAEGSNARFGLSFPQPDDVNEQTEDLPTENTHNSSSRGTTDRSTKTAHGQDESKRSQSGQSYVTARESLEQQDEASITRELSEQTEEKPTKETTRVSSGSSFGPVSSHGTGLVGAADGADSTSSLIKHDRSAHKQTRPASDAPETSKKPPVLSVAGHDGSQEQGTDENDFQRNDRSAHSDRLLQYNDPQPDEIVDATETPRNSRGLRELNPVSTGLVRFNLPDSFADNQARVKNKVAKVDVRKSLKEIRKGKASPGQLIKAERMLVRVDSSRQEPPEDFGENESLKLETNTVEKWREYIVACRKSVENEEEFVLQMHKTRVIREMDKENRKKPKHEVALSKKTTKINMYSSLDKTIVIWTPEKKGWRIYILRPRSAASSVEWQTFLNASLGWTRPSSLTVNVPDFNLTIELENPFEKFDLASVPKVGGGGSEHDKNNEGASVRTNEEVAKTLINRSLAILKQSAMADILDTWSDQGERIGLAWKRYDRLEWVYGANERKMYGSLAMARTHDLEMRPKRHYPTHSSRDDKTLLEEPAPVEGFLVRVTSQKGRDKRFGKKFFKKLYFSTHNQFFCFCAPSNAYPPKPPVLPRDSGGEIPSAKAIAEKIPLVYAVNPFPVKDGGLTWLAAANPAAKKEYDQQAYEESERVVKTLLETTGYINLTQVTRIRKMSNTVKSQSDPPGENGGTEDVDDGGNDSSDGDNSVKLNDMERSFEFVMKNGLVVRFQAFDKQARKEWVNRLREITAYWKFRAREDMELYKVVRQENLKRLDVDEEMESYLGQFAQKWEVSRALASGELFNMCGISACRSITMAGTLYRKPRLHSTFKRCSIILTHGKLLVFQSSLRKSTGKDIAHVHHERQDVVDLADAYVYSGLITEADLLYHNQTFDSNHPGHHALPRVYLEDNWTSTDEDTTTCFVIWHGKRKSFFKAHSRQNDGSMKQKLRYVSSLGAPGRSMVFKTRSRAERDHWVMNLNVEIERLHQGEDIRVIPPQQ